MLITDRTGCKWYTDELGELKHQKRKLKRKHVVGSTHQSGHTLDLIITRSDESIVSNIDIYNPLISDHDAVLFNLAIEKPKPVTKNIQYRSLKKIDYSNFCDDINVSSFYAAQPTDITDF